MKIYSSKIGFWAYFCLFFFLILAGYNLINQNWVGGAFFTLFSITLIWGYLNTKYIITKEVLIIKPFGPTISLKDIINVDETSKYYYMASPAFSAKRLMIKYNGDSVFVSPKDEEQFVQELKESARLVSPANANAEIQG